ncbi:MAG TPA: SusD/RagB family nutrient-binding outer membrane lipoprotein [Cyclobacteriaceae bacterium]|nr:SusD/RagB family nutrient-binding outer membrane lipoprotein [Cyclobacteriaceae bacterium]
MKKIIKYTAIALLMLFTVTSCDEGFDELNTNPVQPTSLDPIYLMNRASLFASHSGNTLPYELAIVQQIVSPNGGVLAGGNYNQDNRTVTLGNWNKYYREVIKHTTDVIDKTKDDPERTNLYHMARILHAYAAMVLTDSYGDVPYFDAGKGFLEEEVTPTYDSQESIYQDLLSVLEQAVNGLSNNAKIETGDIFYDGNIDRWKKLANSLMLRAAMRHSKVNPDRAREWAVKAIQGGVMESNEDNWVIYHDFNYFNALGNTLNATEANNYYLAEPFQQFLSETNDPRLGSIAVRFIGARNGPDQNNALAGNPPAHVTLSRDPQDQIGFPMGYDNATIAPVITQLGLASFYEFSQVDRTRMASRDAPIFLVTYSQTLLLVAEATLRGWVTGDVANLYAEAVQAHMQEMADYGPDTAIPQAVIDAYLAANPLDTDNAFEAINNQYWVSSFLNGPEAFANFRRSGFPALTPNPYPGSEINGDFIRRLTYPDSEFSVNNDNIQQAVTRQGPDNLDTRVWWDVN